MAWSSDKLQLIVCLAFYYISLSQAAFAAEINISPTLLLAQHYSDNLFLENDSLKEEDYITEFNPGFSLSVEGQRLGADIDYALQNLIYTNNSEYDTSNHQLSAGVNSELIQDNLFFDVEGRIHQQIVAAQQRTPVDNINIGNQTEVKTLSLVPSYKSDIGGYVSSDMRYAHGIVKIEEGASDSVSDEFNAEFLSGPSFSKLTWRITYRNLKEEREGGDTFRLEDAIAEVRYKLYTSLSMLARAGYVNNEFETRTRLNNGSYQTFGLSWRPNRKLRIDALYDDDYKSVTTTWAPTSRTSLLVGWRETYLGVNVGKVWNGEFTLRTKRTRWSMTYQEDTTTTQQLQLTSGGIGETGGGGISQPLPLGSSLSFGLTDEVFVRKLGRFSLEIDRSKSDIAVSYFNETREYQESEIEQKFYGGSLSWDWRLGAKTTYTISGGMERRYLGVNEAVDDFQYGGMSLAWSVNRRTTTSFEYRYTKIKSELEARNYTENRIMLRLDLHFSDH